MQLDVFYYAEDRYIDFRGGEINVKGVNKSLTAHQCKLLKLLAKNVGITICRDRIIELIWEEEYEPSNVQQAINDLVSSIRELDKDVLGKCIITQKGMGYKFKVDSNIQQLVPEKETDSVYTDEEKNVYDILYHGVKLFCIAQGGKYINNFTSKDLMPNVSDFDKWLGDLSSITLKNSISMLWTRHNWDSLYIGRSGAGKSTSLFLVMRDFLEENRVLPLYVDMERCIQCDGPNRIINYIYKNYVEKFPLEVSKNDIYKIIYNECEKTDTPKIILMLDGLASCSGEGVEELQTEIDMLRINGSLQTIMTSSNVSHPFILGNIAVQRFDFETLTKEQIDTYIEKYSEQKEVNAPYEILSNPLVLTIYARTNDFIGKHTGKDIGYLREEIKAEADVLWNLFEMYAIRFSEKTSRQENKLKLSFLFRFVLPYIAFYMEKNVKKAVSLRELVECVQTTVELLKDDDFCDVYDEYYGEEIVFDKKEVKDLFENVVSLTGVVLKNEFNKFSFNTEVIKSFLSAAYIYRLLVYRNIAHKRTIELETILLSFDTMKYLGELSGEYLNKPIEVEGKWKTFNHHTEIVKAIELYRNQFNSSGKMAVSSLIASMKISRANNLAGVDLSRLDLRRNTFSHVICSVPGEGKNITTKFDECIVDRWMFGTAGFCKDLACCKFFGDKIVTTNGNGIVSIYDVDTHEKIKDFDTEDTFVQSIAILSEKEIVVSCMKRGVLVWDWQSDNVRDISDYINSTLFYKAEYIEDNQVVFLTRNKKIFFYDLENDVYRKTDLNANNISLVRDGIVVVPTRGREIYVYDSKQNVVINRYEYESVVDSYATKAIMTRDEKTIIFSTKKGVIVEWNRGENKAENIYNLDDAINDFCMNNNQEIIFCPTEKGTLWCIDRRRNTASKIDMSIERRWGSIDIKDNMMVLSSIEGASCLYDINKNEATLLHDDTGKYIIPFLHMEGCSFKNLHSMSDLDERLKDDLRIQGVNI